jgi:peptide-methionine (R)-S-oxide reductase
MFLDGDWDDPIAARFPNHAYFRESNKMGRSYLVILFLAAPVGCNGPAASDMPAPTAGPTEGVGEPQATSIEAEKMTETFVRTDEQWKEQLTPEQYFVLRQKGTERPYVNQFDEHFEPGVYACAGCGQELFHSDTKFQSGCGWPAFYAAQAGDRVTLLPDHSHGMVRTEVLCARCNSHLGHIFDDAPQTPTGQRYCINSVALTFLPAEDASDEQPLATPDDGS